MDPMALIRNFYVPDTALYRILVNHSRIVTQKALEIADNLPHLNPDLDFIETAAMLHDIGIFQTRAESIGCTGEAPYVCHGYLGRKLLDEAGLPEAFGMVCERHTGAGITEENIQLNDLPLPCRDMVPVTTEEIIICVADKYHSKDPKKTDKEITTLEIIEELGRISPDHADRFSAWAEDLRLG